MNFSDVHEKFKYYRSYGLCFSCGSNNTQDIWNNRVLLICYNCGNSINILPDEYMHLLDKNKLTEYRKKIVVTKQSNTADKIKKTVNKNEQNSQLSLF